jgi:hypothetical protein
VVLDWSILDASKRFFFARVAFDDSSTGRTVRGALVWAWVGVNYENILIALALGKLQSFGYGGSSSLECDLANAIAVSKRVRAFGCKR